MIPWKATVTRGNAGGPAPSAVVDIRIEAERADTVAEIEYLVQAAPYLLAAARGAADALREAGKAFTLHNPNAIRPNIYELHETIVRDAIKRAEKGA